MQTDKNLEFLNKHRRVIFGIFIVTIALLYAVKPTLDLDTNGVITIAHVVTDPVVEHSNKTHLKVYYNGKMYDNMADTVCTGCNGNFFFIRMVKNKPEGKIIIYNQLTVADCILQKPLPKNGWENWSDVPTCK